MLRMVNAAGPAYLARYGVLATAAVRARVDQ
jgi:hypothetical protein